jgi:hypothetical protein
MAAPPVPPRLEDLGERHFSFYPPIVNVDHNEWLCKSSNWSEILVHNTKSSTDIWIPRAYVGEISKIDEPVMIVGLKRELEYKGGSVWPYVRKILPMPANPVATTPVSGEAAPPTAGRSVMSLDSGTESGIGKMIGIALVVGVLGTFIGVSLFRQKTTGGTIEYRGVLQAELGLTSQSDYHDVVRKLGKPEQERWKSDTGERQYQVLVYPRHDLIVILMGADRKSLQYIGAKDSRWRTIHSVNLPGGGNTEPILRTLERF